MGFNKKAFTLVELLVVIAIIAVIVAILLPALQWARELTQVAVCGEHLHQNYLSVNCYANDNKGLWPKTTLFEHTDNFYGDAHYYLWQAGYMTNPKSWYCPGDKSKFEDNWQITQGKWMPKEKYACISYQYRAKTFWPSLKDGCFEPSKYEKITMWVDKFCRRGTVKPNHKLSRNYNRMFSDGSVVKIRDARKRFDILMLMSGPFDYLFWPGASTYMPHPAFVWYWFDHENWTFKDHSPFDNL